MQAVGKKNRTSLHSLYYFVLMTRGILCIGISNNLLEYARIVEAGWGIKAIQIFLHKDEGHYENPADKKDLEAELPCTYYLGLDESRDRKVLQAQCR